MHDIKDKFWWGGFITIVRLAAVLLICVGFSFGQFERASLSGTVVDVSGAKIPNAAVGATEQQTGEHFTTTANQDGVFNFLGLPVGQYNVTAEAPGFARSEQTNVALSAASNVRTDFQLKPGSVTTDVSVVAVAPVVEAAATTTGFDLPKKEITDLPLQLSGQSRNVNALIQSVPGVSNAGFGSNIMGGIGFSSELIIDGASATYAPAVPGVGERPISVEAVDNFKVVTTTSAEYGMSGGGFVVVTTKSGTNAFHGDAYEYLRNEALDAKDFFATAVAPDKEHEFGFTLGGPLKKGRTFFFGQFDDFTRNIGTAGQLLTLPTVAMRQGDFSALLGPQIGTDSLGRPVYKGEIYDPSTTRTQNGKLVRDPFPGNIIPSGRLSSISRGYQAALPTNVSDALVNNYLASSSVQTRREPAYFIKLDHQVGGGVLSGSLRILNRTTSPTNPQLLPLFYGGQSYHQRITNIRASYTLPIRSNMTNAFTFGLDGVSGGSVANSVEQKGAATIGLQGIFDSCTPNVQIQGVAPSLGDGGCGGYEGDNMWKYNDNLGYFTGKHSIKLGIDFNRYTSQFKTYPYSHFGLAGSETGLPGSYLGSTGYGYASFLLGEIDNTNVTALVPKTLLNWNMGAYVQDEYRATQKLTLNYGVRYDWQPQFTSPYNDASQFNPSIPNPAAGGRLGALEFLGSGSGRDGKTRFSPTYTKGFGPRFGVAYSLNDKTVLRASYGLFWAQVSEYDGEQANRQGFYPSLALNSTTGGVTSAFSWNNGVPKFNTSPVIDPSIANGQSTALTGKDGAHPPQIQVFNITAQRELPGRVLLELQYNRNVGHHLHTADSGSGGAVGQINQLDYRKYGQLGSTLYLPFDSPEAVAAGVQSPYPGFSGTVAQALLPYPQYSGIAILPGPFGNSIYDGGLLKLEKRFSSGLTFQTGYIYSKTMSDMSSIQVAGFAPQDAYNRKGNWSVSDIDVTQSFTGSYAYDLPLGNGKRFVTPNRILNDYVIGGWTVSGINSYASGTPLAVSTNISLPSTTTNVRPDIIAGVKQVRSGGCGGLDPAGAYLNKDAFADPAPFTFGNSPRLLSSARSCALQNEDIALMKTTSVFKDRVQFQLGADFFNVFNRHIFNSFQTDIDDPGFGAITGASSGRRGQLHAKFIW